MKKKSKTKKYAAPMTLAQARSVATYGPLAGTRLAQAYLILIPAMAELDRAEAALAGLIADMDLLSHLKEWDRALLDKVEALKAECLVAITSAWKWRTLAFNLFCTARAEYHKAFNKATPQDKHDLRKLRQVLNKNEVSDPRALKLLELVKETVLAEKLNPAPEDHHGVYNIVLRPAVALRYRLPWIIGMMPLSSPELQGKLTVKQIMLQTGETGKAIADDYRRAAQALGLKLARQFQGRTESRFCECGEPLEKRQQLCEQCRFHRVRSPGLGLPFDITWPMGRKQEASWQVEDRERNDWSGYDEWLQNLDTPTPKKIGVITQGDKDARDIREAHRNHGWDYNTWKQIKFTIDAKLPTHMKLYDSGKGWDEADSDDYDRRQSEVE